MILTPSMGGDYAIKSSIGRLHPTVVRARNADTEPAARCDAEAAGVSCLDSAHSPSEKPLTAVDVIKKSRRVK